MVQINLKIRGNEMRFAVLLKKLIGQINNKYEESYNKGEGVIIHYAKTGGEIILENTLVNKRILIRDAHYRLANIGSGDIVLEKVNKLENSQNAHTLDGSYGFNIYPFKNGVALVEWTLYPDGRYFEDEDGFGGENCNETTVFGYMDTLGKIIIPFQDMNNEEIEKFRHIAEQKVKNEIQYKY